MISDVLDRFDCYACYRMILFSRVCLIGGWVEVVLLCAEGQHTQGVPDKLKAIQMDPVRPKARQAVRIGCRPCEAVQTCRRFGERSS